MNIGGEKYTGLTFKALLELVIKDVENKNIYEHDKVVLCVSKENIAAPDDTIDYRWKGFLVYSSDETEEK